MRLLFQYVTTIGGYPLYNIDLLAVFLSCFLIYRYAKPKKYFPFYIMGLMVVDSILLYLKYKDYITPLNILFPWVMSGVLYASYKGLKYLTDNNKKEYYV